MFRPTRAREESNSEQDHFSRNIDINYIEKNGLESNQQGIDVSAHTSPGRIELPSTGPKPVILSIKLRAQILYYIILSFLHNL
jgi:hypothetical protein